MLRYRVLLPQGCDVHTALGYLRELEQEDPLLHVVWDERLGQVHLQLMGEVQVEILQSLLERRFGLKVTFDEGGILYKETISQRVEGVGHYEPLRHYAEVHLLLEPLPRGAAWSWPPPAPRTCWTGTGSGWCSPIWRRSPTWGCSPAPPSPMCALTLVGGAAHLKHTGGGDFRRPPTGRCARACGPPRPRTPACCWSLVPLHPAPSPGLSWAGPGGYAPALCPVRSPGDPGGGGGALWPAPVACLRGYAREVAAYTKGRGQLSCLPDGYAPCHNTEEVVAQAGYDIDGDLENTADPCFAAHAPGDGPVGQGAQPHAPAQLLARGSV